MKLFKKDYSSLHYGYLWSESAIHLAQDLWVQFKTGASLAKGHQDSQGWKDLPQEEKLRLVQHGEDVAFTGFWKMEPVAAWWDD